MHLLLSSMGLAGIRFADETSNKRASAELNLIIVVLAILNIYF